MRVSLRSRLALVPILMLALLPGYSHADSLKKQIAPGVIYSQEITGGGSPQIINLLEIDLKAPGVRVRTGQALGRITETGPLKGREIVTHTAAREQAIAAVNADFFPFTGMPLGLTVRDGELIRDAFDYRASLNLTGNRAEIGVVATIGTLKTPDTSLTIDGVNRNPEADQIVLITPASVLTPKLDGPATVVTVAGATLPVSFARTAEGGAEDVQELRAGDVLPACPEGKLLVVAVGKAAATLAAHVKRGDALTLRFDLALNRPTLERGRFPARSAIVRAGYTAIWRDVQQAVGGGPILLKGGSLVVDGDAEDFPKADFVDKRHPRTAVGITADGKLLLIAVDGRSDISKGVSLQEMANILKRLGAVDAMNLDGGGSTTMVIQGAVVNAPSDGRERPVADALLVYGDAPRETAPADLELRLDSKAASIRAGESVNFSLGHVSGEKFPGETAIWGTEDGLGFITQKGRFTGYHAGVGKVIAFVGGRTFSMPITITSANAASITAKITTPSNFPAGYHLLQVTVKDRWGNRVQGVTVKPKISAGQVVSPLITDSNGEASAELVWQDKGSRSLELVTDGASLKVKQLK